MIHDHEYAYTMTLGLADKLDDFVSEVDILSCVLMLLDKLHVCSYLRFATL